MLTHNEKSIDRLSARPLSIKYKGRFRAVAGKGQISRKGGDNRSVQEELMPFL